MFEHVVLRRAEGGQVVSAGQIAEALLYYQHVHLVIDRGTLLGLLKQIGMSLVLSLLQRSDFSAVYCEEILGTKTDSVGAFQIHAFVAITFSGSQEVGELKSVDRRLEFDVERSGVPKNEARRFAKVFLARVPVRKLSGNHFLSGGITEAAKRDALDTAFTKEAIRRSVAAMPGGYLHAEDLKFDVIDSALGMHVFTNISFQSINRRRAAEIPPQEAITPAHLMSCILEARADLALASFYGGDFVTSTATSAIIQIRHAELLRRLAINMDSRNQFTEVVLPDCRTVAEVIDSSERSFAEFLVLLDLAAKFKEWLKSVNPDESLIRTYVMCHLKVGYRSCLPKACATCLR